MHQATDGDKKFAHYIGFIKSRFITKEEKSHG